MRTKEVIIIRMEGARAKTVKTSITLITVASWLASSVCPRLMLTVGTLA